ncbi:MAG: hypothetical protein HDR02_04630 [Lachnospiraceae bacterium]|nr:hypothetical protein [Lachnospiraceae bacterium]
MNKSLGDYIQDRTESLDSKMIQEYFIQKDRSKIERMLDTEQYLVEGSRGVGKTMLMRKAELDASNNFEKNNVLAVWISFEESIRIERIRISTLNGVDPFLQWTMGKILLEVLRKIIALRPKYADEISDRLSLLFSIDNPGQKKKYNAYLELLNSYVDALEKADIESNDQVADIAPSKNIVDILDNPNSFKSFILKLIEDFSLQRIVLLFDEAAHVFSDEQQVKFFTFFKGLRDPKIACKAAVYPGITNYGKYFEKNQDAKELRISWSIFDEDDVMYIKKILKKRIQAYDENLWNMLTNNDDVIKLLCYASNGNPRFAFHIIDEMQNTKLFSKSSINISQVINCLRSVNQEKWKDFLTLKQRMLKYSDYIVNAEKIMKEEFLPNIRSWNQKRRKEDKKLSVGFYIEENTYRKIEKVFDILSYSNIVLIDDVKKSIGHGRYAYYILINPSFLFSERILTEMAELKNISNNIDNNQVYSDSSSCIDVLIKQLSEQQEYYCSNNKCDFTTNDETFTFCKKCGSPMKKKDSVPLYKILRGHSIDNLNLSSKIIERLKTKFSTIGEIYDTDIENIRMKYIQDVRVEKIKSAAIEYMAG